MRIGLNGNQSFALLLSTGKGSTSLVLLPRIGDVCDRWHARRDCEIRTDKTQA
jgi:hypothetical protein